MEAIVESREELIIINDEHQNPTLRQAHFLVPTLSPDSTQKPFFPQNATEPPLMESNPVPVSFNGWNYPQKAWVSWVNRLTPKHRKTWEKAGVLKPIMSSTHRIPKPNNADLVLELAKKWRPETNTFFFSFAEATLTLDDVTLCHGYSLLGSPPFSEEEEEDEEAMEMVTKLNEARVSLYRTRTKKATHFHWMSLFELEPESSEESEIEHVAFISLWLSRFVFPGPTKDTVSRRVFPLAVRLARGARVSLAPAVLAGVYKDLTCLRSYLLSRGERGESSLSLWSPMQIVLVWVFERFSVTPKKSAELEEPRLARWDQVKVSDMNLVSIFNSARFSWRPYDNDEYLGLLLDKESFARCIRVSNLVGLDPLLGFQFVEKYSPNRVARQFGFDQDLARDFNSVTNCNEVDHVGAWRSYNKQIMINNNNNCLDNYFPARLFVAGVTLRYFEWWESFNNSAKALGYSDEKLIQVNQRKNIKEEEEEESSGTNKNAKSVFGSTKLVALNNIIYIEEEEEEKEKEEFDQLEDRISKLERLVGESKRRCGFLDKDSPKAHAYSNDSHLAMPRKYNLVLASEKRKAKEGSGSEPPSKRRVSGPGLSSPRVHVARPLTSLTSLPAPRLSVASKGKVVDAPIGFADLPEHVWGAAQYVAEDFSLANWVDAVALATPEKVKAALSHQISAMMLSFAILTKVSSDVGKHDILEAAKAEVEEAQENEAAAIRERIKAEKAVDEVNVQLDMLRHDNVAYKSRLQEALGRVRGAKAEGVAEYKESEEFRALLEETRDEALDDVVATIQERRPEWDMSFLFATAEEETSAADADALVVVEEEVVPVVIPFSESFATDEPLVMDDSSAPANSPAPGSQVIAQLRSKQSQDS